MPSQEQQEPLEERVLVLNGEIATESWLDDDVTPEVFKEELMSGNGPITVWINSPGGDCIAAAQIYNMLREYKNKVTVKIDGLAASAASVIAMAGSKVIMSPVSLMMIHNPATIAFGDSKEMEKVIDMLNAVKDSIMNAYEVKTGLKRNVISNLMNNETWIDANKAVELGFADEISKRDSAYDCLITNESHMFEKNISEKNLTNKLLDKYLIKKPLEDTTISNTEINNADTLTKKEVDKRLSLLKNFI